MGCSGSRWPLRRWRFSAAAAPGAACTSAGGCRGSSPGRGWRAAGRSSLPAGTDVSGDQPGTGTSHPLGHRHPRDASGWPKQRHWRGEPDHQKSASTRSTQCWPRAPSWSRPWAGPVLMLPPRHEKAAFKAKHVLFHSPASENRDQLYSRQMLLRATFSDPFPTSFSAVTPNLGRFSQGIRQILQHRLKEIIA